MKTHVHPLAADYLDRLEAEARRLPDDQARDLIEDIREHLAAAVGPDSTEADVRRALDRLGTPAEVVDAAAPEPVNRAEPRWSWVETAALVCLVAAEPLMVLVPFAAVVWIVGVVLLVASKVWTRRQKVLGFVGVALGFPLLCATFVVSLFAVNGLTSCTTVSEVGGSSSSGTTTCTPGSGSGYDPRWILLAAGLAYLALQVFTIWRLARAARRRARP